MKKSLFFFAAAALALTACTSDNEATQEVTQKAAPQAVAFDTYVPNTTRAGLAGVMTTTTLQTSGFGVFAQYSNDSGSADGTYNNDPAGDGTKPVANFMWNQALTYTSAAWSYSPLKYWPNETVEDSQAGTDGDATSSYKDKLSFFAYAPYAAHPADTYDGKVTGPTYTAAPTATDSKISADGGGIEGIIANNAAAIDPWVRYSVASTPSESVDLLWGVAPSGGLSYTDVTGGTTEVDAGMPLVDLIKPKKDAKIKFLFQHALARLGLTVVAALDQIAPGGEFENTGTALAPVYPTKIAVESVNITETTTPSKQLFTKGTLNLKNTTAFQSLWVPSSTSGTIDFTVSGTSLNDAIEYKTNASTTYTTATITGVTTTEKPVIADNKYFMVIPSHADTQLQVVITYYVITADPKLAGGYSEVKNVITKKVTIPTLTNNKAYNLKLVLGMTSVKLDAEVAEWKVDGSTEVYLPQNVE
jgi:hypothetical protein